MTEPHTPYKHFEHYCVVRHEHLNKYGNLFGGHLLAIIDEMAYVACVRTWPDSNFVTRAIKNVEFHAPARLGHILETVAHVERVGNTSCEVRVQVTVCDSGCESRRLCYDGSVVMVRIDDHGKPAAIPTFKPCACNSGRET